MKQFYLDKKNAKVLPYINDVVTVKTEYVKRKLRKPSTINEAYLKLVEEEGNIGCVHISLRTKLMIFFNWGKSMP